MVKAMWALCVLLAVATVGIVVWPRGGAADGAWGALSTGSPMASAPTLLPNHDFEKEGAQGWAHRATMITPPGELPEGGVDKNAGRTGGAFRLGNERAKKAVVRASYTMPIRQCDFFFDGFVRGAMKSGKGWVGIEVVFESGKGEAIATYLSYASLGGGKPAEGPGIFLEPMAASDGGWSRMASHTSAELKARGLEMPSKPEFLTINLCVGIEDGEGDAWFDDLDLRDMTVGR